MFKNIVAIFFSILLLALISAPSIIIAIDDSVDTSMFYSVTEEEESSVIKLKPTETSCEALFMLTSSMLENIQYRSKEYSRPDLNLICPPPESNKFLS